MNFQIGDLVSHKVLFKLHVGTIIGTKYSLQAASILYAVHWENINAKIYHDKQWLVPLKTQNRGHKLTKIFQ